VCVNRRSGVDHFHFADRRSDRGSAAQQRRRAGPGGDSQVIEETRQPDPLSVSETRRPFAADALQSKPELQLYVDVGS